MAIEMPTRSLLMRLENVEMKFKQGRGFFHALSGINLDVWSEDFI